MNLRNILFSLFIILTGFNVNGQSKTTELLQKNNNNVLSLFFYNNTLRMINQSGDPAFDELMKDIEKMKFLMINKVTEKFDESGYKKLVNDYKAESFEIIMNSSMKGKNFDIFLKEEKSKDKGMIILVNDDESLYVLDIVGSLALNNVSKLYNTLEGSSDIGRKIQAFTNDVHDDAHDRDSERRVNKEKNIEEKTDNR